MQNYIKSNLTSYIKKKLSVDFVRWLPTNWANFGPWHLMLMPLSWLFLAVVVIRKWLYQHGVLKSFALSVPVIIVGNINVGGTGKTPLVIYLVQQLKKVGLNPGVISRGYGSASNTAKAVLINSTAIEVGDEPLLLKQRLKCPVYIHQNRVLAGQTLLAENPQCDIIVSDDGLQHYRLQRFFEIAVVDAAIGFGNGALLPAGPLREPASRLNNVNAIVMNGSFNGQYAFSRRYRNKIHEMQMESHYFYNLADPTQQCEAEDFIGYQVIALAGIGNPSRFFKQLAALNLQLIARSFPDHYAFSAQDFINMHADFIIMTEKDAVKCQAFAQPNFWVMPISANLDEAFMESVYTQLALLDD